MISDEEFRSHREQIETRQAKLQPSDRHEHQVIDSVRASLADLKKPLSDLVATWKALPQRARARFQHTLFPVGYVLGRVGTADLGLLFRVFRSITDRESNGVPLTYAGWNQLEKEIALCKAIMDGGDVEDG